MKEILDVSKGRSPLETGAWFYRLFSSPLPLPVVKEKLASAWWVEEEDLRQNLLTYIWRKKIYGGKGPGLRYILGYEACRWLLKQGIFKRQSDWEEDYELYHCQPTNQYEWDPGLEVLFDNSLDSTLPDRYEQYLFYLNKIIGYGHGKLEDILLLSERTIKLSLIELNRKMEDL